MSTHWLVALLLIAWPAALPAAEGVEELLSASQQALQARDTEQALALADKAVALSPAEVRPWQFRASLNAVLGRRTEAIADLDAAIRLAPAQADLYDRRGSERFKAGHIAQSIEDFDHFLRLRPELEPQHWKRGISYYYAGRFADGRKQFEGYQTFENNDVENAVWRYLCMARADGVEKARAALLPIQKDPRVPMMEIYDLYGGKKTVDDVLRAARAGNPSPERLNERLFYAHLYLGLYYEAAGDQERAKKEIFTAAEHPISHYMGDVARVHAERLRAGD